MYETLKTKCTCHSTYIYAMHNITYRNMYYLNVYVPKYKKFKNSTLDLPVCREHCITNYDGALGRHQFRSLHSLCYHCNFAGKQRAPTIYIIIIMFCWRCEIHARVSYTTNNIVCSQECVTVICKTDTTPCRSRFLIHTPQ